MKKHLLFYILLLFSFYGPLQAQSGINIDEFSTAVLPTGWMFQNLTFIDEECRIVSIDSDASNTEGFLISPNYQGVSNGTTVYISFTTSSSSYNFNNYEGLDIQYSTDNGSTWKDHPDWRFVAISSPACYQYSTTIPGDAIVTGSDFKFRIRTHFTEISGDEEKFDFRDLVIKQDTELPNCDATITGYPSDIDSSGLVTGGLSWSKPTGGIVRGYTLSIGTSSGEANVLPLTELGGDITEYILGNLNPLTTYYVSLVPKNDLGSATGCKTQSFTLPANPTNTSYAVSELLTVNSDGSCTAVKSGTTTQTPNGVWYSFIATKSSHLVSLKNIQLSSDEATSDASLDMNICESTGPGITQCSLENTVEVLESYTTVLLSNSKQNSRLLKNLTIGNRYYVHVFSKNVNANFDICVGSETTVSCGDRLTDSGGVNGIYATSESSTTVIRPSVASEFVTLTFNSIDIDASDDLRVYNGPDSSGTLLFSSSTAEGSIPNPITSSHSTGALTVRFDTNNDANVAEGYDISVSCISLNCSVPLDLTTTTTTATTANLSWTAGIFNESAWNVQYGKSGFTLGEGTVVQASTNPFTINDLEDGSLYEYYVQSDCGNGDTSPWSYPFEFRTKFSNTSCAEATNISELPFRSSDKTLLLGDNFYKPSIAVRPDGCDFNSTESVLWYHFYVETSGTVDISCSVSEGNWLYSLRLFSGMDCTNTSCEGFSSPIYPNSTTGAGALNTLSNTAVTAGSQYWLAIHFDNSGSSVEPPGTLDVSITSNDVTLYTVEKSTNDFVMTWQTTTANETITIPTKLLYSFSYKYQVDWDNDGIWDLRGATGDATHTYAEAGTHTVRIRGRFPRIYFNGAGDKDKIQSIEQWGNNPWDHSLSNAFMGCSNLQINAKDAPDLQNVTDLSGMFAHATSMNSPLNHWDVSNIEYMSSMFAYASSFNQPLNDWNVSNTEYMSSMFAYASSFNQSLSDWDVSGVRTMYGMFNQASSFNQSLATWDVTNVSDMERMLSYTALSKLNYSNTLKAWSQEPQTPNVKFAAVRVHYFSCIKDYRDRLINPPNSWRIIDETPLEIGCDTGDFVTTWRTTTANESITIPTFSGETYDYDIDWDNDGVWDLRGATGDATHSYPQPGTYTVRIQGDFPRIYFNFQGSNDKIQSVEQWGDIEWTNMNNAFWGCSNLQINATDVPDLQKVTDLSGMFAAAKSMNAPLNGWNVSSIVNMRSMFEYASSFNQPLNDWDVSQVTTMLGMFNGATAFNQSLATWNVSNVTNMGNMFQNATAFNQSLATWNVSNVTNMGSMLNYTALSVDNYSNTLDFWSKLALKPNVSLNALGVKYSDCVQPQRNVLTNAPNAWTIIDDGSVNECSNPFFEMTWQTTMANETITIPTFSGETYKYKVDWNNDDTFDATEFTGDATHTYAEAGTHTVRIRGTFPRIYFNGAGDKDKIQSIKQWGTNAWTSMENAFEGCSNLQITATDFPDLSNVTSLSQMFNGATSLNQSLATWDVSNVTDMTNMLDNTALSTENYSDTLKNWSQLENLNSEVTLGAAGLTYFSCIEPAVYKLLNRPNLWAITDDGAVDGCSPRPFITTWKTTTANESITIPTFSDETYDYDIDWDNDGVWDLRGVTGDATHSYLQPGTYTVRIRGVFPRIYFNFQGSNYKIQSVEQWGDIEWTNMNNAFWGCTNLQINATDAPDLQKVTDLSGMFAFAYAMNAPLNHWNVSSIVNMRSMFEYASSFNQPLNDWDVSQVTTMLGMFNNATAFNQSLATWNVSNVTNMGSMLDYTALSTDHYSSILKVWSQLEDIQPSILLGAQGLKYSNCVQRYRDLLTNSSNSWSINDASFVEECTPGYLQIGVDLPTAPILGIESTERGLLLPRMTEAQMRAIADPAEGLMVYCLNCTNKGLFIFDGTNFINLTTGQSN